MSIHWPCYCTVHVYVVIHYCNGVLSFWFEMNLSRFILIVYICMVCFVDICWIVDHHFLNFLFVIRGRCDRDHMVVGFTTCAISAYRYQSGEFESHSWLDVLDTTLCDNVCQWLVAGQCFSPVSSTNKTDHHDKTEISVALNNINLTFFS